MYFQQGRISLGVSRNHIFCVHHSRVSMRALRHNPVRKRCPMQPVLSNPFLKPGQRRCDTFGQCRSRPSQLPDRFISAEFRCLHTYKWPFQDLFACGWVHHIKVLFVTFRTHVFPNWFLMPPWWPTSFLTHRISLRVSKNNIFRFIITEFRCELLNTIYFGKGFRCNQDCRIHFWSQAKAGVINLGNVEAGHHNFLVGSYPQSFVVCIPASGHFSICLH